MKNDYQPVAHSNTDLAERSGKTPFFVPQNFEEAERLCQTLAASGLTPKAFYGKPKDILVAMIWAHTLKMEIPQALASIAVINGKPSLYGDAIVALVRSSPVFEWMKETSVPGKSATCTVKRKGEEPHSQTFTMDQALRAGLISRNQVWKNYPDRMLQMRARSFALRDVFADVLMGMSIAEEVEDYSTVDNDGVAAESAPAETKRMPKRRSKAAAKKPAEKPVEAVEVVEEVEDVVEVQEVEQAPEQAAAPEPEDDSVTLDSMDKTEFTLKCIKECQTMAELMELWKHLEESVREDVKADFTNRRIEIQQGGNQ